MAPATVVADASALICLALVDQLSILPGLFGRVLIPPAVAVEATRRGAGLPDWVDVRPPRGPVDERIANARLGAGETEVLCLGLELPGSMLILDDGAARDLAVELRLRMTGTAAVLVAAKRAGLIPQVRPVLDALRARGFRVSPKVYHRILESASEEP
jgi:predicted nucleic acid-binding protein